jgi:hypothetical protein
MIKLSNYSKSNLLNIGSLVNSFSMLHINKIKFPTGQRMFRETELSTPLLLFNLLAWPDSPLIPESILPPTRRPGHQILVNLLHECAPFVLICLCFFDKISHSTTIINELKVVCCAHWLAPREPELKYKIERRLFFPGCMDKLFRYCTYPLDTFKRK